MIHALQDAKSVAIRAKITRADGTIENRGIISYRNKNPLLHYPVNGWIKLKDIFRK